MMIMQPQCFLNRDRKLYSDVSFVPSPFSPPTALFSFCDSSENSSVDATVDYNTLATIVTASNG